MGGGKDKSKMQKFTAIFEIDQGSNIRIYSQMVSGYGLRINLQINPQL